VASSRLSPEAAVRRVPAEPMGSRLLAQMRSADRIEKCRLSGVTEKTFALAEFFSSDLGQTGTKIFLRRGLDWANQLDAPRQIGFSARIDDRRLALNTS
jgi:hypothetical protein